jgi:large repetitive protein
MPKAAVVLIIILLLCLVSPPVRAQSLTSSDLKGRTEKAVPGDPVLRQQWYRRGRQGVQGTSAAGLRLDAFRQMVKRRNAISALRLTAGQIRGTSSISPQLWSPLGPSPILSNASGSATAAYDYGPVIGRVTSLFVDPGDSTGNTVYLGGPTGGLWRSTNAASAAPSGVTWSALLDGQPTLSVGAIGIQPGNSNLIILGTGEPDFSIDSYYASGFLRSADNGSTWSLISSANSGPGGFTMDLKGIAFSSVVFSTDNPSLVVAGAGASGIGFENKIETVTDERFGIFYSTDAGQNWTRATFLDGATLVKPWSVSSVVYNSAEHLFYAAVGFQGIYSSSDGATWSRLASQPGAGLTMSNCPAYFSTTCPIFRGALAGRPGADEMYVWYVDLKNHDQGIYQTTNGGQTWTALNEAGITNCGDAEGCGTQQGFFDLVLSAVPQSNGGTDLYVRGRRQPI